MGLTWKKTRCALGWREVGRDILSSSCYLNTDGGGVGIHCKNGILLQVPTQGPRGISRGKTGFLQGGFPRDGKCGCVLL